MSAVHIHLFLNHLPVMGTAFACVLLAFAMATNMESFKKLAYTILVFTALATPPVFLSGEGAEEKVEHLQGISESAIGDHEEAGEAALAAMIVVGILSLCQLILYFFPNMARIRSRTAWVILIASGLAFAWLAWTANLGGLIRHGEEIAPVHVLSARSAFHAKPRSVPVDGINYRIQRIRTPPYFHVFPRAILSHTLPFLPLSY